MFVAVATILSGGRAHAASFTVAAGNDENTDNSSCALSEAIENINDQATTNTDCTPTGAYGTDDTINLPTGTITLAADLPQITESVTIQGQGMGVTAIDGDGQWVGMTADLTSGDFTLTDVTIASFKDTGVRIVDAEVTTLSRVEVDGTDAVSSAGYMLGLGVTSDTVYDNTVNISDVYIHDFDIDASGILQVFAIGSSGQSETNATIDRVTIARIQNTGNTQVAILGAVSGTVNGNEQFTANMSNITVTDITSINSIVLGIGIINFNGIDMPAPVLNLRNATVNNVAIPASLPADIPVVSALAAAMNDGDTAQSQLNASNVIISNSSGSAINCGSLDIGPLVGGAGVGAATLTSNGGNISDDNSTCEDYFTQSTDRNNVSGLGSTLSALADNGGYVPTMALKQGSPAIDAGVAVTGLTTDARLVSRPQGAAFDSGAYEYVPLAATSSQSLASTGQNQAAALGVVMLLALPAAMYAFRRKVAA